VLFAAPPEKEYDWNDEGIYGISRFLNRVWNLVQDNKNTLKKYLNDNQYDTYENKSEKYLARSIEASTKQVTESNSTLHLNTAVSALMELYNVLRDFITRFPEFHTHPTRSRLFTRGVVKLLSLLNPFAPHITEELWEQINGEGFLSLVEWPQYDPALLITEEKTLAIQVNGKVRGQLVIPADLPEEEIKERAKQVPNVQKHLNGSIRKIIYVKDHLVNIVVQLP